MLVRCVLGPLNTVSQRLHRVSAAPTGRTILLYAVNPLMLDHLLEMAALFSEDTRLRFRVTWPLWNPSAIRRDLRRRSLATGLATISPWLSLLPRCDLIVLADPSLSKRTEYWMGRLVPKLYIGHQMSRGKTQTDTGYRYNEMREHADEFFNVILESSEANRAAAIATNPALEPVIKAVGYLRADRLLAQRDRRDEIRKSFSLDQDATLVFIQSTWHHSSLMESMGVDIVAQAEQASRSLGWSFVFSTHPHHWHGPWAVDHPWGEYLAAHESERLRVLRPSDIPDPHLVASDVIVTDHTSQAVLAALLESPMLFVRTPGAQLLTGSNLHRLADALPSISTPAQLVTGVQDAIRDFRPEAHRRVTAGFLSHRGDAARRVRHEIYALLGLHEPLSSRQPSHSETRSEAQDRSVT